MSSNNFSLEGVASKVRLGKAGPQLKNNNGVIEVKNVDDTTLAKLSVADGTNPSEATNLSQLESAIADVPVTFTGFDFRLGDIANGDGSWTPGAVPIDENTKISAAIDGLNEVLSLLVPAQPPAFPNAQALTLTSVGTSPLQAAGAVPNNTGTTSPWSAGQAVTRLTSNATTNLFSDMGPGNSGTVTLFNNGASSGSRALTGTGDNGTYGNLVIADQKDFPTITPGFWKSIDISGSGIVGTQGTNRISINHSAAGSTGDVFYIRDNITSNPVVSSVGLSQSGSPTFAYSSSVPHYGDTTATLTGSASVSNLSGETYYGGSAPFGVNGTNSIIASQSYTYATLGITTPITRQTVAATPITPVSILVNGTNIHNSGLIQAVSTNVNGSSAATNLSSSIVLVKRGTVGSRIDEMNIPITIAGTTGDSVAQRISSNSNANTPNYTFTGTSTDWVQNAALSAYEAAVVAGLLSHNQTNYSTGYLPVGPDLSVGRTGAQYITFWFRRTPVSKFDLQLTTGASGIAGCWIKLVGQETTSTLNGWFDMSLAYSGSGAPGAGAGGNGSNGCALGGVLAAGTQYTANRKTVTFGTLSSASATNNSILVRFRLNSGQTIPALSILAASN
jgi:hypothetical protein